MKKSRDEPRSSSTTPFVELLSDCLKSCSVIACRFSFHRPLNVKVCCVKLPKSRKRLVSSMVKPCLLALYKVCFSMHVYSVSFFSFSPFLSFRSLSFPSLHLRCLFFHLCAFEILCFPVLLYFFQFFIVLHEKRLLLTGFMRS